MIKELTQQLIAKFSTELKHPENFNKIQTNFLNPLILYTSLKLYPYFLVIVILFLIISLFSLANFFLLMRIFLTKKNIGDVYSKDV
jgi:hypothetical protein